MTKEDKSSASHIGKSIIKSGDCEQVLGVKIDSKPHFWFFYDHVKKLKGNCEH